MAHFGKLLNASGARPALISPCLRQLGVSAAKKYPVKCFSNTAAKPSESAKSTESSPLPSDAGDKLSWDEFFRLRRSLRLREQFFGVPTAAVCFVATGTYISTLEIDPTVTILGMDPLLIYGASTIAGGLAGFLVGPFIGSTLWRLSNRNIIKDYDAVSSSFSTTLFDLLRSKQTNLSVYREKPNSSTSLKRIVATWHQFDTEPGARLLWRKDQVC